MGDLKLDLNDAPRRGAEIDVLNRAGDEGWELVGIASNNTAYLKRPIEEPARAPSEFSRGAMPSANDGNTSGTDERKRAHEVAPKYRDPTTNETWSGRGRMANWLTCNWVRSFAARVFNYILTRLQNIVLVALNTLEPFLAKSRDRQSNQNVTDEACPKG